MNLSCSEFAARHTTRPSSRDNSPKPAATLQDHVKRNPPLIQKVEFRQVLTPQPPYPARCQPDLMHPALQTAHNFLPAPIAGAWTLDLTSPNSVRSCSAGGLVDWIADGMTMDSFPTVRFPAVVLDFVSPPCCTPLPTSVEEALRMLHLTPRGFCRDQFQWTGFPWPNFTGCCP